MIMNEQQSIDTDSFSTTDLGCTAALVASGAQVLSLNKSSSNRVTFIFRNSVELSSTVEAYWNGELSVDAKTYFETQKWLKSRIYNG